MAALAVLLYFCFRVTTSISWHFLSFKSQLKWQLFFQPSDLIQRPSFYFPLVPWLMCYCFDQLYTQTSAAALGRLGLVKNAKLRIWISQYGLNSWRRNTMQWYNLHFCFTYLQITRTKKFEFMTARKDNKSPIKFIFCHKRPKNTINRLKKP